MRRVLSLFIVLCLMLGLCGCGSGSEEQPDKDPVTTGATKPSDPTPTEPQKTEPTETEPTETEPTETEPTETEPTETEPTETEPTETEPTETEPTETEPTEPKPDIPGIDRTILGKYKLYKMKDPYGTYGYADTIVAGGRRNSYIQLYANGTADLADSGDVLTGLDWDPDNMTITDGNVFLGLRLEGDEISVSQGGITLYYLREDSAKWGDVQTGFDLVYKHINRKGNSQNGGKVVSFQKENISLDMIAASDGTVRFVYSNGTGVLEMELLEWGEFHQVTYTVGEDTATATIETEKFSGKAPELVTFETTAADAAGMEEATKQMTVDMLSVAWRVLNQANIMLKSLGFVEF